MGMTSESLAELAKEIMAQGHNERTAYRYAALIGDTPLSDGNGNTIVRDERGRVLATLKPLKMFSRR